MMFLWIMYLHRDFISTLAISVIRYLQRYRILCGTPLFRALFPMFVPGLGGHVLRHRQVVIVHRRGVTVGAEVIERHRARRIGCPETAFLEVEPGNLVSKELALKITNEWFASWVSTHLQLLSDVFKEDLAGLDNCPGKHIAVCGGNQCSGLVCSTLSSHSSI